MENMMNTQLQAIFEELELITDPYQRADIRVKLLTALNEMNVTVDEPVGKDAIKNDTLKAQDAPIEFEEVKEEKKQESKKDKKATSKKKEEKVEETKEEVKEEKKSVSKKTTKKGPKKIEIDETVEPIVVQIENEDGEVEDLDITEAYYKVKDQMEADGEDEETISTVAQYLTAYSLMPIFDSFENLKASYNKMMLAYYMQEYGVDEINAFVASNEVSDGAISDVYEFVNDDNLEFLITKLEEASEEE